MDTQGTDLDSETPAARLAQAQALSRDGRFQAALDQAEALRAQAQAAAAAPGTPSEVDLLISYCLLQLERFEPAIAFMTERLDALVDAAPSTVRAKLLIRMAYAQSELTRHAPAMRAANLALRDALALDDSELAASALERLAMSALSLGDALLSERFMLEALGFYEQAAPPDERLRNACNGLFLYCSLFDRLKAQGDDAGATALLQRSRRIVNRASSIVDKVDADYLRGIWRCSEAVWLLRRGEQAQAEAQMRDVHAEALRRAWHTVHRPMSLELSGLLEARGEIDEAIAVLQTLFDPAIAPLRNRVARDAHARLQRLLLARGDAAGAARHAQELQRLNEHMRQQQVLAHAHMDDLGDLVTALLAEADQRRLEDELTRLRQQYASDRSRWTALEFEP